MSLMQVATNNNESPFDSIRRIDANGNEYWLARELMKLMGYSRWENFVKSIEQAKENMEIAGDDISIHIADSTNMVKRTQGGGRNLEDFKLSRYAAYHTALACDGRKSEVALAKKYFVVKTRQAEILENKLPEVPKLPVTRSVLEYVAMAERMGFSENPHIKLYAERLTIKEMGLLASKDVVNPDLNSEPLGRITTATVRAVELGYKINKDNGSQLGKWVKSKVKPLEQKIQEGQYMVFGYWSNNELDNAIHSYFTNKLT
jgi:hypothetical protein